MLEHLLNKSQLLVKYIKTNVSKADAFFTFTSKSAFLAVNLESNGDLGLVSNDHTSPLSFAANIICWVLCSYVVRRSK